MTRSVARLTVPVCCALALALGGCSVLGGSDDRPASAATTKAESKSRAQDEAAQDEQSEDDLSEVDEADLSEDDSFEDDLFEDDLYEDDLYDDEYAASSDLLDSYVELIEDQLPSTLEAMGDASDAYSAVDVYGWAPGTIEYVYYFAEQIDADFASDELDNKVGEFSDYTSVILSEMDANGIVDASIRYTYYNADGSEIWTHLFEY